MMHRPANRFWREAFAIHGSITPIVMPYVLAFGAIAAAITLAASYIEGAYEVNIGLAAAPYEFAGAALGLLLILRTNSGYDRWWEARKLWGGIVNQSRNLVIDALSYGPQDAAWRSMFVRYAAAFPHAARASLRGQPPSQEVVSLLGPDVAEEIASANHMPSFVALRLARLLRIASDEMGMDRFYFMQTDRERALLIDHVGGCERILKTPLPTVYGIKIRRFIALFLFTLPFALLHRFEAGWLIPLVTMLVAYPVMSLDQIGIELQNPFAEHNLSHLPLDDISQTIQRNVTSLEDHAAPNGAEDLYHWFHGEQCLLDAH